MASFCTRSLRARPLLVGGAVAGSIGVAYYSATRRPLLLDSPGTRPTSTTFSFPSSMIFSRQLTVTNVEQINHDTKRVTFALPGGPTEDCGVPAGAAILTQHTPAGKWFPVLRPYTPVHDTDGRGELELVVKRYPGGRASGYIHSLEPGDKMTVRGPLPGYAWTPSLEPRDVLFVAGGAGITPLYSLAKAVITDKNDQTRIKLIWGVNGTRDLVLRDELEQLQRLYPEKLQVTYVVSGAEGQPDAPSLGAEGKWKKGYIDDTLLKQSISQYQDGIFGDEKGTKVFFCGPPSMQSTLTGSSGVLQQLGVTKKSTHIF